MLRELDTPFEELETPSVLALVADYAALAKLRIVTMVLVTTVVGFYLGSVGPVDWAVLLWTLLGTGLAAAGTLALNQYMERDFDAKMERTRSRPIPAGRIAPLPALAYGVVLTVAGLILLQITVNPLAAAVTAATAVTYLFVYTPLKQHSPLCSLAGAVPGALPPVTGWAAASGSLDAGAMVLFTILFLWQLPHSLAIARLYVDDYRQAGFRLLPVVDPSGFSTERHIVGNSAALLVAGLFPTLFGIAGSLYFVCALVLGIAFLAFGVQAAFERSSAAARRLLFASLVYLPCLLTALAMDRVIV